MSSFLTLAILSSIVGIGCVILAINHYKNKRIGLGILMTACFLLNAGCVVLDVLKLTKVI